MDCVDSRHQLRVLPKEGIDALLHTTGMVAFLAVETLFKALRPAKCSSALATASGEVTVLHLKTSQVKHSAGGSRCNYILPLDGSSGQNVGSNEGGEKESDDEPWGNHGINEGGNEGGNDLGNCASRTAVF